MDNNQQNDLPWGYAKIVRQGDSGELLSLEGNIGKLLQTFVEKHSSNTPLVFVTFAGPRGSGKSFLTNLFAWYLKHNGKIWMKQLEKNSLNGYAYGNGDLKVVEARCVPDNDSCGVYMWPELFEINHHSTGKKLLGIFHVHHKQYDKQTGTPEPLDVFVHTASTGIINIVYNGMVEREAVHRMVQLMPTHDLREQLCQKVLYLNRSHRDNVTEDTRVHSAKEVFINESPVPLHCNIGKVTLSNVHQQVLEKLFRCIVDQTFLHTESVGGLSVFKRFLADKVNMINKYANVIISTDINAATYPASQRSPETLGTDFTQTFSNMQTYLGRVAQKDCSQLKVEGNEKLDMALAHFFKSETHKMSHQSVDAWLCHQFQNKQKVTNESLTDAYVADFMALAHDYQKSLNEKLQHEFAESVYQKCIAAVKPVLTAVESYIRNVVHTFHSSAQILETENICRLVEDAKVHMADHLPKLHLQETINFAFERTLQLCIDQAQALLAAKRQCVNRFEKLIIGVLNENVFLSPVQFASTQKNLIDLLCAAYENVFPCSASHEELRQSLADVTVSFYLEYMNKLKSNLKKLNSFVTKYKSLYEEKMTQKLRSNLEIKSNALAMLHSETENQILQDFVSEVCSDIRENEPQVHVETLKVYINKSFAYYRELTEENRLCELS